MNEVTAGIWIFGMDDRHAHHEEHDRADLHVGREVVARAEEQPDRKRRRDEARRAGRISASVFGESVNQRARAAT